MSNFAKNNYLFVKNLVPFEFAKFLFNVVRLRRTRHLNENEPGFFEFEGHIDTGQVPGAFASYGCAMFDQILLDLQPKVEELTGLKLFPTYSYNRLYITGDRLAKHTDRRACEISVTLALGHIGDENKVFVQDVNGEGVGYNLESGDAIIYRGLDVPHWREIYNGVTLANGFFHYVNKDGPHTKEKYDKRDKNIFKHFGDQ